MKICSICKIEKPFEVFSKNRTHKDGLQYECKTCRLAYRKQNAEHVLNYKRVYRKNHRASCTAYNVQWRNKRKNRTPKWLNVGHSFEMECIYTYANALNSVGLQYHVDHIIPLQGEQVSGLHTPDNLQVITAEENLRKGNKYDQAT